MWERNKEKRSGLYESVKPHFWTVASGVPATKTILGAGGEE